jgi:hypothetical protein
MGTTHRPRLRSPTATYKCFGRLKTISLPPQLSSRVSGSLIYSMQTVAIAGSHLVACPMQTPVLTVHDNVDRGPKHHVHHLRSLCVHSRM